MLITAKPSLFSFLGAVLLAGFTWLSFLCATPLSAQAPVSSASPHPVGTVKAIQGNKVTLATAAGSEMTVSIQASTQMVRALPGQKNLKEMAPMALPELQVGDRILVRGEVSSDGKSIAASSVIVMKGTDVAARQQQEREDWQRRGLGGLVSAVDAESGTVTLSAGQKSVVVRIAKNTVIRRYAPDSVKFDDAKPGSLGEIKPGDQLCARGVRSADGNEIAAEEIVSGTFRNIAGTVNSIDPANATINVMDLITKKPVTVKITADSQLRNLPPFVAQRIAMRLKGGPPEAKAEGGAMPGARPTAGPSGEARNDRPGGAPDLQQILSRMPAVSLGDLRKGEAVIMVATMGSANSSAAAITLLTGVEAILTAAPSGSGAAGLLSPWNLNTSMGESSNP
jgi:preprotein translocase subunit YajC